LTDKLTALFEQRHARRYGQVTFEIGRSIGGSVATFYFLMSRNPQKQYFRSGVQDLALAGDKVTQAISLRSFK